MIKKIVTIALSSLLAIFVLIQFVPYGHNHTNPPVIQEPNWDSPKTKELAQRACYDCHSNESTYPWYSNVAPVSWLVQRDIEEGRLYLNFSDWGHVREPYEISEAVSSGWMPPSQYTLMHPDAKLTQAERQALVDGINATIKNK